MKKKFLFAAFLICGTISSVAEEKPKYKDASLPVEERVEDLLRRMTLHEKVLQLQNNSIIRKSKFPQNPKRSVRFSGKGTKRSVQKRKARNTQKAETKVL